MSDTEESICVDQVNAAAEAPTLAEFNKNSSSGPMPMDLKVLPDDSKLRLRTESEPGQGDDNDGEGEIHNKKHDDRADEGADGDIDDEDDGPSHYRRLDGAVDNNAALADEDKSTSSPCSVPDSAVGCRDRDLHSLEIERACMESQGEVNVKWDITRKNKTSIVINGYKMTESRAGKDGRIFWRCSKRFCSATAISLGQRLLSVRQVDEARFHNHPPTGREEFFRGDFSTPGTSTSVTVKWPVLRASSARGSATAQIPKSASKAAAASGGPDELQYADGMVQASQADEALPAAAAAAASMAAATAAMLPSSQAQTVSSLLAAAGASQLHLGQQQQQHYQQQQLQQHLYNSAKRMRHGSIESGGSSTGTSEAALSDPLCASQQRQQLDQLRAASGGLVPSSAAAAADVHKSFLSLASSLGLPYSGLFPNSLPTEPIAPHQQHQQQLHRLQHQHQHQQHQQQLHRLQHQHQHQQQQQHSYQPNGSNMQTIKSYHSIFNPPQPMPMLHQSPRHHQQPLPPPQPPAEATASPLKEALSQVDNFQLQRQLRRLDGYFRSGIVALTDTLTGHQGAAAAANDADFVAWERDSMTRLFAYMDGLERVQKLASDLP
ncbi:hypothetical protein BOX15_Mlig030711g2 [Macrostomum lignano]|uniref:FLYWCH-type domain-containing protein n=1 Tax=Macrostomum lignano TaxID=282301 RepID=A0A267E0N1_9PLAT|nr:hypothetical protein BOX15_Mlig030711g2 [Macrostomum lignano]